MKIYETELNDELLHRLIDLSAKWEAEGSCYGYRTNGREDIEGNRIFIADDDGVVVGYLLGHEEKSKNAKSIMPDETPYFEIDEIYVLPENRSQGIGKALFSFVEQEVKQTMWMNIQEIKALFDDNKLVNTLSYFFSEIHK